MAYYCYCMQSLSLTVFWLLLSALCCSCLPHSRRSTDVVCSEDYHPSLAAVQLNHGIEAAGLFVVSIGQSSVYHCVLCS